MGVVVCVVQMPAPVVSVDLVSLRLFRSLMRMTRVLPSDVVQYYRGHLANNFRQHRTETDPEEVDRIRKRSLKDARWVLQKYAVPEDIISGKFKL